MFKILFTTAICSFSAVYLLAQESQTPILNSNRIGFTESSRTVFKGGFLLESGMSFKSYQGYYWLDSKNKGKYTELQFAYPQLNIAYGVTKNFELRLGSSFYKSILLPDDIDIPTNSIKNEFSFGAKLNLTSQKGMLPQSAILVTERLVTFENSKENIWYTQVNLAWSYQLGKRIDLAGNVVYSFGKKIGNTVGTTVKLSYNISDKWTIFAEHLWNVGLTEFDFGLGVKYQPSPRWAFFARVGTYAQNDYQIRHFWNYPTASIGVSFLLNNPNKIPKHRRK